VRKDFYNRWVKEDVHKALFVSFEQEAQDLLDKYLDEVEAMLDQVVAWSRALRTLRPDADATPATGDDDKLVGGSF